MESAFLISSIVFHVWRQEANLEIFQSLFTTIIPLPIEGKMF